MQYQNGSDKDGSQHLTLHIGVLFVPPTNSKIHSRDKQPSEQYPRLFPANMSHIHQLLWIVILNLLSVSCTKNTLTIRSRPQQQWAHFFISLQAPIFNLPYDYFFPVRGFPLTSDSYKPKQQWSKKKLSDKE